VVILLFGAKKLPDAARSLGKSMRIFRSELREMQTEDGAAKPQAPSIETSAPASQATVSPQPVQSQRVEQPAPADQGHTEARQA
jgi:sec-independent protein translocase protein TatA